MSNKFIFTVIYFPLLTGYVHVKDIPCLSRTADYGFVCVCNETYCDTIETPPPLERGLFYHYSTSELNPGFTKSVGTFHNTTRSGFSENGSSSDVYFLVDASVQYQKFFGIGGGLTDSAGINFNTLSPGAQQKFVESYFGTSGLEYTFGRVPVAATDFSLRFYSYNEVPGDVNMKYFNLTEEDFTLKIPLIKMAVNVSRRGIKLLATPWTAPSWMKTNNGSRPGYLLSYYHHAWTNYLLKFFEAYKETGLEFWGLSQGNELVLGLLFGFGMPNLIMLPNQMRMLTKNHMGPMLRTSNFSEIKILTLDDERPFMSWWSNRIFSDEDVAKYIDGMALHSYFDNDNNVNLPEKYHMTYPDKFILYTENSIGGGPSRGNPVELGSWDRGVRYITNILQNFNHWCTGYIDWNIALDGEGGPASQTHLDAPIIVNASSGEFYKQPMFFALGHFSKFVPPGSIRINCTTNQTLSSSYNEDNIQADKSTPKLLRSTGTTKSAQTPPSTTLLSMATISPDKSHTVIVYNPQPNPVNVIVVDSEMGTFNQTVEANSINTFIYW